MPPRIPKSKFLELTSKGGEYPEQLKKLRKPGSTGPHLPPAEKRLGRYGYHQYRGPAYIHLHDGRSLYDLFPGARLTPAAAAAAKTFPAPAAPWRRPRTARPKPPRSGRKTASPSPSPWTSPSAPAGSAGAPSTA